MKTGTTRSLSEASLETETNRRWGLLRTEGGIREEGERFGGELKCLSKDNYRLHGPGRVAENSLQNNISLRIFQSEIAEIITERGISRCVYEYSSARRGKAGKDKVII